MKVRKIERGSFRISLLSGGGGFCFYIHWKLFFIEVMGWNRSVKGVIANLPFIRVDVTTLLGGVRLNINTYKGVNK